MRLGEMCPQLHKVQHDVYVLTHTVNTQNTERQVLVQGEDAPSVRAKLRQRNRTRAEQSCQEETSCIPCSTYNVHDE